MWCKKYRVTYDLANVNMKWQIQAAETPKYTINHSSLWVHFTLSSISSASIGNILQSLGLFIISLIEHSSLNDITTDKSNVAVKLLALGMTKKIIIKKSVVFAVFYWNSYFNSHISKNSCQYANCDALFRNLIPRIILPPLPYSEKMCWGGSCLLRILPCVLFV